MSNGSNKPEYITPARLKSERGWSDSVIKRFLGQPDKSAPNPKYPNAGAPMRLYLLARVQEAETSQSWIDAHKLAETRSKASRARAQHVAQNLIQTITDNLVVTVPSLSEDELSREAIRHYNSRTRFGDQPASTNSDPFFLDRIKVNYLRHNCTVYDTALDGVRRQIGADQARTKIRDLVLQQIAKVHPALADECERQRRDFSLRPLY